MSEADPPGASVTEATRWLGKASDDLAIARVVTNTPDLPRWPACFHAQQAAEKALKAYLVAAGIEFPFTHALDRLADLVEADGFELDRSTMVDLQPWAVAGRYPEDVLEPSTDEAQRLTDAAQQIVHAVQARITQPTDDSSAEDQP